MKRHHRKSDGDKPSWLAVFASICLMSLIGALWFQIAPLLSAANTTGTRALSSASASHADNDPSVPNAAAALPRTGREEAPPPPTF